jgi:hypothetical protein
MDGKIFRIHLSNENEVCIPNLVIKKESLMPYKKKTNRYKKHN